MEICPANHPAAGPERRTAASLTFMETAIPGTAKSLSIRMMPGADTATITSMVMITVTITVTLTITATAMTPAAAGIITIITTATATIIATITALAAAEAATRRMRPTPPWRRLLRKLRRPERYPACTASKEWTARIARGSWRNGSGRWRPFRSLRSITGPPK
ncbi:hypothetical protein YDYSG_52480 [Paenibacillus tyrfis]|nr:hypothetical protein YDYSG_52480 [Paenibacillus tyrfis]